MMRLTLALPALCAALTACTTADTARAPWHSSLSDPDCCLDIAHAAGNLDGTPYTNSIEALRSTAAAGRTLIEIDIALTSDAHLVLSHDWDRFGGQAPSLAAFRAQRLGYTPTQFSTVLDWMRDDCPDCTFVTDAKDAFWTFWPAFTRAVPPRDREQRFIVQTYSVADSLKLAKLAPRQRQILTLYRHGALSDADLEALRSHPNLIAVTMPLNRVPQWAKQVSDDLGTPVYTHAYPWMMENSGFLSLARSYGARGFYMD